MDAALRGVTASDRPIAVEVLGEAGIGKTTLINDTCDRARQRGVAVWSAAPTAPETSLPWSTLRLLVPFNANALPPSIAQLQVGGAPDAEPAQIAFDLSAFVTRHAAEFPLCIVLDDAMWVDAASAACLTSAMRAPGHVLWIVGRRPNETCLLPTERIVAAERFSQVRLGGLSFRGTCSVLQSYHPVNWTQPNLRRIHRLTGGHPLFVAETGRLAAATNTQSPPLPPSVHEVFAARVRALTNEARALLTVAALAIRPTIPLLKATLAAAVDDSFDDLIGEIERAGLGTRDAGELVFRHGLVRPVVIEATLPSDRRSIVGRLAEQTTEPAERAEYLASLMETPDESVAAELEAAARQHHAAGSTERAAELFELAASLTLPGENASWRRRMRGSLGANLASGAWPKALEQSTGLLEGVADSEELVDLAVDHMIALDRATGSAAAIDFLATTVKRLDGDPLSIHLRILLCRAWQAVDLRAAKAESDATLLVVEQLAPELAATARALGALNDLLLAEPIDFEALAESVDRWDQFAHPSPTEFLREVAVIIDRLDLARTFTDEHIDQLRGSGRIGALAYLLNLRIEVAYRQGRWADALISNAEAITLTNALGVSGNDEMVQSERIRLLALCDGDGGELDSLAAMRDATASLDPINRAQVLVNVGVACLTLARYPEARSLLAEADDILQRLGILNPQMLWHDADLVEALVRCNDIEQASVISQRLLAVIERVTSNDIHAEAWRADGLVAAARGETDRAGQSFDRAIELAGRGVRPFTAARCELDRAGFLARQRQRNQAREGFLRAKRGFEQLGSRPYLDRCDFELNRLGRSADDQDLSLSERNIAEMAAGGKSNREIAAEMFISVRTVESTLTRVYRKLGVRSRTGMIAAIRSRS